MPASDRCRSSPAPPPFLSVAAAAVLVLASLYPASAADNITLGTKLLATNIGGWQESTTPSCGQLVATSSETGNMGVEAASMGDDGNFILVNSSGSTLWQSFDTPTDTLVSSQRLHQGVSLTVGQYSASLQDSGNLSLSYTGNGGFTYWSSNTVGENSTVYAFLSAELATFSIYNEADVALKSWFSKDYISTALPRPVRRVTLGPDGNVRIYTSSGGGWVIGWEALEDYCQIYAYCGPYGLCTYNESSLICTCATQAGYVLIDERTPRSGCRAIAGNGTQDCAMVELIRTLLWTESKILRYGDSECSLNCLHNPECKAATALSDGSGTCQMILSNNFFSGNQELSISTNSFFKFCGLNVPPAMSTNSSSIPLTLGSGKGGSSVAVSVVVSVLATLAVLAVGQVGIWWMCCRKNPRWGGYSAHYALLEYASGAPVQFTHRELRKATGNFREKLGEGGFGAVYKGELPMTASAGGTMEVAVKRLEGLAEAGEKQFRMEVAVIGSTHHMNLVRLCGFCTEGRHRLLVYEYMKNGSLDKYLFAAGEGEDEGRRQQRRSDMDWDTRYNVLLGTARGITYLHQECRDCIIHSDIKPENILLDGTFTAKVSDFGLAKLTRSATAAHNASGHHVTHVLRGTRGYLAPEWRSNLPITVKADVFSYGMVVLETVSGRKSFEAPMLDISAESAARHVSFLEWVYRQYFLHKEVEGVVDERIKNAVDMEQLERAMKVAFWCVQVQPSSRPSMSKVIQMLDGSMQDTQIPPMPKSFGDHSSNIINQEESNYLLRDFEQKSSAPPSSIEVVSYPNTRSTTTVSNSTSSHPPKFTPIYSLNQSLVRHQVPPPPLPLHNVHNSF
ncbi:hypothetical protein GOP47_0003234 [Adiantum capillus-veneris]|uniref:non-specific serine/threonine protein kinase n=1 Tax=Adiantum capillus-veneris TaxID=13818 RepID=A0A9D4VBL2_ADICA|nr:hypothetical protein GOP47_0003234 [Adiantum capillus-veneris]